MKVVTNKTRKPIRIPLAAGKFLHLGPLKTGQIADHAADLPAIRKLLESGEIEITGEGEHTEAGGDSGDAPREARPGHPQNTLPPPKGNR